MSLFQRFNNRLVTIEEKVGELESRSVETTQTGEQEEKEVIKNEQNLSKCWTMLNGLRKHNRNNS